MVSAPTFYFCNTMDRLLAVGPAGFPGLDWHETVKDHLKRMEKREAAAHQSETEMTKE